MSLCLGGYIIKIYCWYRPLPQVQDPNMVQYLYTRFMNTSGLLPDLVYGQHSAFSYLWWRSMYSISWVWGSTINLFNVSMLRIIYFIRIRMRLGIYFPVLPSTWSNMGPYRPSREFCCGSTRKYTWSGEQNWGIKFQ